MNWYVLHPLIVPCRSWFPGSLVKLYSHGRFLCASAYRQYQSSVCRFLQDLAESPNIRGGLITPNTKWALDRIPMMSGTKHVDIRTKFVVEYRQEGITKIIFLHSEEHDSDIITKNLGSLLYSKHFKNLISRDYASGEF